MKPGDMVVVLNVHPESTGYANGVRERMIGTIKSPSTHWDKRFDWLVEFPGIGKCNCPEKDLRKIEPPEAGDWKYCVWQPEKDLELTG